MELGDGIPHLSLSLSPRFDQLGLRQGTSMKVMKRLDDLNMNSILSQMHCLAPLPMQSSPTHPSSCASIYNPTVF